jgi:hypothetical protein
VPVAPSTYYAPKTRSPSKRSTTDAETLARIEDLHQKNYGVYGGAVAGGEQGHPVPGRGRPAGELVDDPSDRTWLTRVRTGTR